MWRMIERLTRRFGLARSIVAEVVTQAFCADDLDTALAFYGAPWPEKKYCHVQIGDGLHGLDNVDEFYARAWITFFRPPFRVSDFWYLANHAEDDFGAIAMQSGSSTIFYEYNSTYRELAPSFRVFIAKLQAAGWSIPTTKPGK
jgi:hypothetical protein